jgi:cobalt-zinc-cadmium efflux system protein
MPHPEHAAAHDHAHDHDRRHARRGAQGGAHRHDHGHAHTGAALTLRVLWLAMLFTAGFGVVEALAGWWSGSLALLSDAAHMVTDAGAFAVALVAQYVARRPPSRRASYGYARAEVLGAFINALAMLALVVFIVVEAVHRLQAPAPVMGTVVMVVAAIGLGVNLVVAAMLARAQGSINARGALLHVMGDLLGSIAALVAGAVIHFTGWLPIDPLLSLVAAALILRSTVSLLRQSAAVLMEHVPAHLSFDEIGLALARLPGVTGVHDLHVWPMSAERAALSAHVTLADGAAWMPTLAAAQKLLARDYGIDHVTLQPSWAMPRAKGERRVIAVTPVLADTGKDPARPR